PDANSRVVGCRRSTHAEEPGACWRLDASDRQFESQRGSKDRPILGIHPLLGDAIIWIAGLHAVAALFHHFILKNDVLKTMLP
ncbi:MAG: hypothetical protein P4L98_12325, partial [Ancalomicrobiaceae bacterium]|nr:hypothetical protein [Ancalomicrobiaceae bacterium]